MIVINDIKGSLLMSNVKLYSQFFGAVG